MSRRRVIATTSAVGMLFMVILLIVQKRAAIKAPAIEIKSGNGNQVQLNQQDTHDDGFLGVVLADELEHVVCPFDSVIERLLIREGNEVSQGQPLMQLKATHLDEDLDIAREALVGRTR